MPEPTKEKPVLPQPLKCPSCGAPLDVQPGDRIAKCRYCGCSSCILLVPSAQDQGRRSTASDEKTQQDEQSGETQEAGIQIPELLDEAFEQLGEPKDDAQQPPPS